MRLALRWLVLVVLLCSACRSTDLVGSASRPETASPIRLVADRGVSPGVSASVTIERASVSGDTLHVLVSYPGGCRVHGFRLVASSEGLRDEPATVPISLAHDPYGDICSAPVPRELAFDLRPLRDAVRSDRADTSEVVLLLDGNRIRYSL